MRIALFLKISRTKFELRSRVDDAFHKRCVRFKESVQEMTGHNNIRCEKEQITLYEDADGDVAWNEHSFGTLKVVFKATTTGQVSGRPSAYRIQVLMDTQFYRPGNVGGLELFVLVIYFITFITCYKSEVAALFYLPINCWRVWRLRKCLRTTERYV